VYSILGQCQKGNQDDRTKNKFRLKLAAFETGVHYVGLSFQVSASDGDFVNSVLGEACGDEIDYGKLFAYLFRRFGYPNFSEESE